MLKEKTVLIGVTGSIAAYKAATLASMLVKAGAEVRVLMTKNAENIINPITFETLTGHKCLIDTFDRNFEFNVNHVSLAKKADIFLICPATANTISKVANGMADNMLTSVFLAAKCPKIICTAMNTAMYENPITQENLEKCRKYGFKILEPVTGHLACGAIGKGKMEEPQAIFDFIENEIAFEKDFAGKRILVTAGPTQEAIDPVRFITNHSSGKMGYAIAKAAAARGAEVTLVSGPTELPLPRFVKTIRTVSAEEMFNAVKTNFPSADIVIKAAAVADFRPKNTSENKIKKNSSVLSIELESTDDILLYLGNNKRPEQFLCGFSMETENLIENSRQKLLKKHLDLIVANNLKNPGAGFRTNTNQVVLISRDSQKELPLMEKEDVAHCILDEIKNASAKN
ncbi:bifunctional phosphopantothenoylcysteine decarboxylase/phosphopantothenate--cysteine ligase CoaBC [Treponema sp.]|uniref:bifunctional phosphopantothenoylcysteine decarboxylase/phosphopantothenate--cysteine ligase CoaBC n=1 Tax=Treponema sp. TaxID=166 RepID=UPI003F0EAA0A